MAGEIYAKVEMIDPIKKKEETIEVEVWEVPEEKKPVEVEIKTFSLGE